MVRRMKTQVRDWEKISAKQIPDKELACTVCKDIHNLTVRKQPHFKNKKRFKHFTKEDVRQTNT